MNVVAIRMVLAAVAAALGELPKNDKAWTYWIPGYDGLPYVTRTLLPRALGRRVIIHKIHRGDTDEHPHNHPWRTAHFLIVSGGYTELRVTGKRPATSWSPGVLNFTSRCLRPGDVNSIGEKTFHRVVNVMPDTWTVGLIGERCQEWGFQTSSTEFVEAKEWFRRKGHIQQRGLT